LNRYALQHISAPLLHKPQYTEKRGLGAYFTRKTAGTSTDNGRSCAACDMACPSRYPQCCQHAWPHVADVVIKASQSSFPLPPVLLTGFEHSIDDTGDPFHDTNQCLFFAFPFCDLFLVICFGFRIPSDLS